MSKPETVSRKRVGADGDSAAGFVTEPVLVGRRYQQFPNMGARDCEFVADVRQGDGAGRAQNGNLQAAEYFHKDMIAAVTVHEDADFRESRKQNVTVPSVGLHVSSDEIRKYAVHARPLGCRLGPCDDRFEGREADKQIILHRLDQSRRWAQTMCEASRERLITDDHAALAQQRDCVADCRGSGERSFRANRNESARIGALRRVLVEIEDQQCDGPSDGIDDAGAPGYGYGMEVGKATAEGMHGSVEVWVCNVLLGFTGHVREIRKNAAHIASRR